MIEQLFSRLRAWTGQVDGAALGFLLPEEDFPTVKAAANNQDIGFCGQIVRYHTPPLRRSAVVASSFTAHLVSSSTTPNNRSASSWV